MNLPSSENQRSIPKLVHFCFGMVSDFGGRAFGLSHYLAVRSAWEVLRPEAMIMHCVYEPSGAWWDLAKPMLKTNRVRPIKGIYGFPATHPAHRADIVRLAALLAMGGVYADADVLFVKSFDDMPRAPFMAAIESLSNGVPVGLSNAVLMAEPDSHFARLCLEGHDPRRSLWSGFRSQGSDQHYIEYSVRYPCFLAQLCPGLIRVLPSAFFVWAGWDEEGLTTLFERDVALPSQVRAVHLWESHSWKKYLNSICPKDILMGDTTFKNIARPFLPEVPIAWASSQCDNSALEAGFKKMDQICREVDFVSQENHSTGHAAKFRKKVMMYARKLRAELTLQIRCQLDELDLRVRDLQLSSNIPLNRMIFGNQRFPLMRHGAADGSDKMLKRFLPQLKNPNRISYIISTGEGPEPAIAHWLALQSEHRGVWISESLRRAKELYEWAGETGRLCTVLYSGTEMKDWSQTVATLSDHFPPSVLVLAGTGREYWHWKEMAANIAEIIIVACNPAFDPESTLVVSSEHVGDLSGNLWGSSRGALIDLGNKRGYLLREVSEDGQFLLFTPRSEVETDCEETSVSPKIPFVKIRTLYGDSMKITSEVARNILSSGCLVDISDAAKKLQSPNIV
jgi:hypothetical protein